MIYLQAPFGSSTAFRFLYGAINMEGGRLVAQLDKIYLFSTTERH